MLCYIFNMILRCHQRVFAMSSTCFAHKLMEHIKIIRNHEASFNIDGKTFILGSIENSQSKYNILCLEIKRFIYLCRRKMFCQV